MRSGKKLFVILYVFILLFYDSRMAWAYHIQMYGQETVFHRTLPGGAAEALPDEDTDEVHLSYVLNGGENNVGNPTYIDKSNLPFMLEIPTREGYNFAGWYTDSRYTKKVTQIDPASCGDIVLFAKWTSAIDSRYNVEMYSYQSKTSAYGSKELKECSYDFLEEINIPGMPSTREADYLSNIISSEAQCMQGLCFTPEYILMTAYTENAERPGSLMIFDRAAGEYLVTLHMREDSHLGGVAYDGENIWICHSNSRTLERLSYGYIKRVAGSAPGRGVDVTALSREYQIKNSPSSITCYGGRIWVATHTKLFDSKMMSYSYDKKSDRLFAVSGYNIPSKVQGIDFDEDGAVYLSTSYGRNNSSYLKIYSSLLTLSKHPNAPDMKVEMPPCSEQIAIADGNIYVVFESASRKYFEGTDGKGTSTSPIDKVLEVTLASVW